MTTIKNGIVYKLAFRGEISKAIKRNEDNVLFKNERILKENGLQVQTFTREKK